MKTPLPRRLLPLLLLALAVAVSGRAEEPLRTFTNTAGKSLQARVLKLDGAQVTIALADGREFTLPVASLSAPDQEYLKTWKPAASPAPTAATSSVKAETLNAAIGQPLFSDTPLWESDAKAVAERLGWPRESETTFAESFRAYPDAAYRFLGARPYSAALYGEDGKVSGISIVFANKGDSFGAAGGGEQHFIKGKPVPGGIEGFRLIMANDTEIIGTALTGLLGEPQSQRFGEGETRTRVDRWDWNGHSLLLSSVDDEYVGLMVQTVDFADKKGRTTRVPEATIRARTKSGIEKRENGDVILANLPMVDQGPKGYCVPATIERCMRYLGIPADMYLLAMAGETQIGGGTSVDLLLENIGQDIKRKGRKFDKWTGELKMRDVKKAIDSGIPFVWALQSTKEFNDLANTRLAARKTATEDFAAYASKVKAEAASTQLPGDSNTNHVVIVIGYNEATNEIAFSDSWGEPYKERWITIPEAEQVSMQRFYMIDL
ncbi:MAG: C39 family peptidase [Verrucomicrobiales bacterium]|nr:C39 family peptidase [Verrucomicrobiales bacterium]